MSERTCWFASTTRRWTLRALAVGDTILDVATGSGRMLLQILKRGHSVVSGDIDREALDRARERLGDLADKPTLVIMDAHKLQFDDDSFHAVTLANAIHEIDDPRGALDEITRVLTARRETAGCRVQLAGIRADGTASQDAGAGRASKGRDVHRGDRRVSAVVVRLRGDPGVQHHARVGRVRERGRGEADEPFGYCR